MKKNVARRPITATLYNQKRQEETYLKSIIHQIFLLVNTYKEENFYEQTA